ncbi:MAG: hypothetical protein EBS48_10575 [Actinobacteria bacterium]|nr:hypothetical protein [Actinomycetota bacterium]
MNTDDIRAILGLLGVGSCSVARQGSIYDVGKKSWSLVYSLEVASDADDAAVGRINKKAWKKYGFTPLVKVENWCTLFESKEYSELKAARVAAQVAYDAAAKAERDWLAKQLSDAR